MKVAVVGSGGWGTALALVLLENGHEVTLWSFSEKEAEILRTQRENPLLKGVALPAALKICTEIACVAEKELVVFATPSFAVRLIWGTVRWLFRYPKVLKKGRLCG